MLRTKDMERIEKPWGYELIWAKTDKYVGKILHINDKHKLSRQYHKVKEETIMVIMGTLTMEIQPGELKPDGTQVPSGDLETRVLLPGAVQHVRPGMIHRMIAAHGNVEVVEVSTPELDDVVRLDDAYGRSAVK